MYIDLLWALPFVILLGSIAVLPLTHRRWWENNYGYVALVLGLIVICYYLFQLKNTHSLLRTAHEYFSFIVLIGSLFIVSGGIHINVKGHATPLENCIFLFVGSLIANVLGTTGASVVLIRPWIRMNKRRFSVFHVVFFIFLVSNIGGGLTPIGDPPLFLGYLKGVPFFWVIKNVWHVWMIATILVLSVFFVLDTINFKRTLSAREQEKMEAGEEWKVSGKRNFIFLAMILGAVFIDHPPFLRETIMIAAAVLSYRGTPRAIHKANDFNFGPINEVAILFAGIFATMIPALEWLERYATELGISTPSQFYWGCGILSSILDNAPTYLNFLSAEVGLFAHAPAGEPILAGKDAIQFLLAQHSIYIKAISVAAVYFGAMTYIGNGPNFLVKSIVEQQKIKTPSFFGYIFCYSLPILLPIFTLVWFLFFR